MDHFEALAEPVRRRIIDILASGEHTSGQLADVIGFEFRISRTAVSKHLRVLRDAGLVDARAEEKWRWYRLDKPGFLALENAVAELKRKMDGAIGWDPDLRRKRDPLAMVPAYPAVPLRGPGRRPRRGHRGRQPAVEPHASPDDIAPARPMIELAVARLVMQPDDNGRMVHREDDREDDLEDDFEDGGLNGALVPRLET